MSVDLGGIEFFVPEHFLNHADRSAVPQHMGRGRVPDHVGRGMALEARSLRILLHDGGDIHVLHFRPPQTQKQPRKFIRVLEPIPSILDIFVEISHGNFSDRHYSVFISFSRFYRDRSVLFLNVIERKIAELPRADRSRVQKFENGLIPKS